MTNDAARNDTESFEEHMAHDLLTMWYATTTSCYYQCLRTQEYETTREYALSQNGL